MSSFIRGLNEPNPKGMFDIVKAEIKDKVYVPSFAATVKRLMAEKIISNGNDGKIKSSLMGYNKNFNIDGFKNLEVAIKEAQNGL